MAMVVGCLVVLGAVLVGVAYPVEAAGESCGTALRADYTELRLREKVGDVAADLDFDPDVAAVLNDAGSTQASAAREIIDMCDSNRGRVRVSIIIAMVLAAGLVLAAVFIPRQDPPAAEF